jgi:DNA (cytosine-5)-methyltransferase 1
MEHLGDITRIKGGDITPVNIVTFGSPCQSFSIAGQRKGLEGKSGLFWEAIRIIREMREATKNEWPQYCVFENVPGILSANRGLDYKTVLEAFTETEIPMPPSGRWSNAGMVRGGGTDLAWIIHDAQYFGVAQRRRRLFLVCHFTGKRAAEILFKPKSLHGYFTQSGAARKGTADDAAGSSESAKQRKANCLNPWDTQQARVFTEEGKSPTLAGADGGGGRNPGGLVAAFMGGQSGLARSIAYNEKKSPTLKSGAGGNMVPCVCEPDIARTLTARGDSSPCVDRGQNIVVVDTNSNMEVTEVTGINGNVAGTLTSSYYKGVGNRGGIEREVVLCRATGQSNSETLVDKSSTLNCNCEQPIVCLQCNSEVYPINTQVATRHNALGKGTDFGIGKDGDPAYTLQEAHNHAVAVLGINQNADGDLRTAETAYALTTSSNASGRNAPLVCHPDIAGTLCASGAGLSRPAGMCNETDLCIVTETKCDKPGTSDVVAYCLQGNMIGRQDKNGPQGSGINEEVAFTLGHTDRHAVAAVDCRNLRETEEMSGTLQAKSASGGYSLNYQNPVRNGFIVRRLTPVECERLQGYPDGWTEYGHDGKPLSDTARYQALGNSVAIPCVAYVLSGIADEYYGNNDPQTRDFLVSGEE